jgi:ketosteroid isomerase-like protein
MALPSVRKNVITLIRLVERGRFLEAIEDYYAEDATMQENNSPPRCGLAALLEHERRVLTSLNTMHVSRAESFVVDGDLAVINWVFEYTDLEGRRRRLDEVAYQLWQDGKIVRERFYYDPAQRNVEVVPERHSDAESIVLAEKTA